MSATPVSMIDDAEPQLSQEARLVRDKLVALGLETPMIENGLSERQKYARIKNLMAEVVGILGLDLSDDSLAETPKEYGVDRDFITKGIHAGKHEYREGSVWGSPYLRILRRQLEAYIVRCL